MNEKRHVWTSVRKGAAVGERRVAGTPESAVVLKVLENKPLSSPARSV